MAWIESNAFVDVLFCDVNKHNKPNAVIINVIINMGMYIDGRSETIG